MSSSGKIKQFKPDKPKSGSIMKILGLITVALALFSLVFSSLYTGADAGDGGRAVFGRYGNKRIIYSYSNMFGRAVKRELDRYSKGIDRNSEIFGMVRRMAWQQAFNDVALSTAVAYQMEQSGYQPSSRSVDRRIFKYHSDFQTNGVFDEEKYRAASDSFKALIREGFRDQIISENWRSDILSGQYRSSAQLDFLNDMKSRVRSYDYVTFPFSDYPDDDVIRYAEENSNLFDRRELSRITVDSEDTAREVMVLLDERAQDIEAFADTAGEYSNDSYKDSGGSMGLTAYHTLAELMNATDVDTVFNGTPGDITGPFDTEYGWIIVKIDSDIEPFDAETAVDDVRSYMMQNEVGLIEDAAMARAEAARLIAVSSDSFNQAMRTEELEPRTTPTFPFNYGGDALLGASPEDSGEAELAGMASSDDFWDALAPLERIGAVSRPVVLSGAVGLFSLKSSESLEKSDNWGSLLDSEAGSSRQADFRDAVLGKDSKLFVNDFSQTFNRLFPANQNQG